MPSTKIISRDVDGVDYPLLCPWDSTGAGALGNSLCPRENSSCLKEISHRDTKFSRRETP